MDLTDAIRVHAELSAAPWATPSWATALTTRLFDCSWTFAVRQPDGGAVGARATLRLRNNDGELDYDHPTATIGPALTKWTPIRLQSSDDDGSSWMTQFTGFVVNVDGEASAHENLATLTMTDQIGMLARYEVADMVRPVEFTGERVAAILTEIGLPALYTGTIHNGTVVCAAETLNGNALSLINDLTQHEGGFLWAARDGKVQWRGRFWPYETTAQNTSQITLGATLLRYQSVGSRAGVFDPVTRVTITPSSGFPQVYDATAANTPPETRDLHGGSVLFDADAEVRAEHEQKANEYAGQAPERFEVLVFPGNDTVRTAVGDSSAGTATLDAFNRITLTYTPKGWPSAFTYHAALRGISHRVDYEQGWSARLDGGPYSTTLATDSADWYVLGATLAGTDVPAI